MRFQVCWIILVMSALFELDRASPFERIHRCRYDDTRKSSIRIDCSDIGLKPDNISSICSLDKNIYALDLSNNSLSRIIPFSFQGCQTLKILSLANNNLSQLENDAFAGLSELQWLNLDENKLIEYGNFSGPNSLRPLKQLMSLRLHSNNNHNAFKEYLPNVYGTTLPRLQSLYLDGYPGVIFGTNFQTWKKLRSVHFSSIGTICHMSALTNETFKNVPFLVYLDLSNCSISSVEAGTFAYLTNLIYLNLSHNMELGFPSLRYVSYGLQYTKIEVLDYSKVYKTFGLSNQINRCDVWFLRNTTLKEFHISSNRLALVEQNALALFPPTLEVIYADDNKLTFGPYLLQVGCVKSIKSAYFGKQSQTHSLAAVNKEIFLQENRIDTSGCCKISDYPVKLNCTLTLKPLSLNDSLFPENLETIDFSSSALILNQVPTIRDPIPINSRLRSADMSGNSISEMRGSYFRLDSLEVLNISNNVCRNISRDFLRNFRYLTHLDASVNNLGPHLATDKHGKIFEPLRFLVTLDLSNNWIVFLPQKIFTHLHSLEELNLSSNRLENITFEFGEMKNLSKLHLRQNKITTLPLDLLEQINTYSNSKNISIDLSDNSLSFLCYNLHFLRWLKKYPSYFVDIQKYMFHNSSQTSITYEQFLSSFDSFEKDCNSYTAVIVVSTMFVAVFISLTVCGVVYRYRWRLRYLYYMAKARYNGYIPIRDNVDTEFQYDAFISYANENYRFVTGNMLQKLEESGLKLCLHQKDFLPGNYIAENILHAIRNSRKTVIVLSNDFLQSKWCMYEFNMARMEEIYSRGGENVLVVVRYEPFDIVNASTELRECLECTSYLEYTADENEGPYFWQMLIQAIRDTLVK